MKKTKTLDSEKASPKADNGFCQVEQKVRAKFVPEYNTQSLKLILLNYVRLLDSAIDKTIDNLPENMFTVERDPIYNDELKTVKCIHIL